VKLGTLHYHLNLQEEEIRKPMRSASLVPETVNDQHEFRAALTSRKLSLDYVNDRKFLPIIVNDEKHRETNIASTNAPDAGVSAPIPCGFFGGGSRFLL
jgi:hypothetical protein